MDHSCLPRDMGDSSYLVLACGEILTGFVELESAIQPPRVGICLQRRLLLHNLTRERFFSAATLSESWVVDMS
jgi:hypothetical protein